MSKGAFHTGVYRNLFAELNYHVDDIENRLKEIWNDLFYGPDDTRIYYSKEEDTGYLLDTGNLDVRTEGLSYGMMAAVQMDEKEIFDKIWLWAKKYSLLETGENEGYFAWSCSPDGEKRSDGPAPDGEEYFAMALFFASHRWGDGVDPFDYGVQAKNLLKTCLHKGKNEDGHPMWNLENKLIKFIPNCDFTDPSYHLPHFYELFSLWSWPEDRKFWKEAAVASRNYIPLACHPKTGLSPEYAHYDGTPNHIRGYGHFYSDSYRLAANIGLDYEWFGENQTNREIVNNIQSFFANKSPNDYRRYVIDGTELPDASLHPIGLMATNAMASLAANGAYAEQYVRTFWETPLRKGNRRYYDNCLYLFAFLALSGNYRIWFPNEPNEEG